MRVSSAAAGILILSAATVWAQGSSPVGASTADALASSGRPVDSMMVKASPPENRMTSVQTAVARQRMQEMERTLKQMHALLMRMRAKAGSKDAVAKANLEMWQLMLGHLDKQFDQLRTTTLASEDLNARRADLYKQAEAKAAALEAARARGSRALPAAPAGAAERGASSSPGATAPGATAAHDGTPVTSAPASSTPK